MAHRVTFIPGDGSGPELTEATRRVLEATGVEFQWDVHEAGLDEFERSGILTTAIIYRLIPSVKALKSCSTRN